jgi:hypothetical protein
LSSFEAKEEAIETPNTVTPTNAINAIFPSMAVSCIAPKGQLSSSSPKRTTGTAQ